MNNEARTRRLLRLWIAATLLGCAVPPSLAAGGLLKYGIEMLESWARSGDSLRSARAADLMQDAKKSLQANDLDGAIATLEELSAMKHAEDTPEARRDAASIDALVRELHGWRQLAEARHEIERPGGAWREAHGAKRREVLDVLRGAYPQARRFALESLAVKRFETDFRRGVRDPKRWLYQARQTRQTLVDRWLEAPLSRRVFVIGASQESGAVRHWATELERRGFSVFFYDFCADAAGVLCASETVGAFFGSAGHAVLIDSASASASRFVQVEVAAARHLVGRGRRMIVVSPVEVAMRGVAGGSVIAWHADSPS